MPSVDQTESLPLEASQATAIMLHIDSLERQLIAQMNSLRLAVGQLARLQTSNEEVLRLQYAGRDEAHATFQVFRNDRTSMPIPAGSGELPDGLVLPEGWTLTPLNRVSAEPSNLAESIANVTGVQTEASSTTARDDSRQPSRSSRSEQASLQYQDLDSLHGGISPLRAERPGASVDAMENEVSMTPQSTVEDTDSGHSSPFAEEVDTERGRALNGAEARNQEESGGSEHPLPRMGSNG